MESGSKLLEGLNEAQYQAVVNYQSPSLIIAGAGSGKTRVLTSRIAYMIEQGVAPYQILALTFTNKAAREMRERISSIVGERSRYISMGTFHSVFAKILFAEAENLGYKPSFTIYDSSQSQSVIKQVIKELNLNDDNYKPKDIQSRISLAKNNLVTANAYEANSSLQAEDREQRRPEFFQIYKTYVARCKANNAMDFDDLLLNMNILFRDRPDILERYRKKFAYILVDEYQDTNNAQYIILKRLAHGNSKLCVVGDDAQSIYSFRGAKIENIFQFQKDFEDAKVFKLEQNYRSTQTIVDAANSVISKNKRQIAKRVFSENDEGAKIRVLKAYTDGEEAQIVGDKVRTTGRKNGGNWNDIAVLYRTNAQSRGIEEALRKREVPYKIFGGHSFYEHKEIKDLLAYFKLIVNPKDDESLMRVINYPARGIGNVTTTRIKDLAQSQGVSMWEALGALDPNSEAAKSIGKKAMGFAELINKLSLARVGKTLYEFGLEVATRTGILASFKLNPCPDSESALANIEELLNSFQDFKENMMTYSDQEMDANAEPTLEEWLQNISLLTDMDTKDDSEKNWVTLMTVHASKGLEFGSVFLVGLEEKLFPSQRAQQSPDQLEEERRLFYVALTRAKKDATISFATSRYKWGGMEFSKPSRFIGEIDQKYLDLCFEVEEDGSTQVTDESGSDALQRKLEYRAPQGGRFQRREERRPRPQPVDISTMKKVAGYKVNKEEEVKPVEVSESCEYQVGQKVKHAKFGVGEIAELEQMPTDLKITVIFADGAVGKKSLLNKYAKLEVVE